ncbi:MAG: helix-turn-helix domain-containing protein [Actinomycetota bacterium]
MSLIEVDGLASLGGDATCHRLMWPTTGSLRADTGRRRLVATATLAAWVPAGHEVVLHVVDGAWVVRFPADNCPISWTTPTQLVLDGFTRSVLAHLGDHADRPWAAELASAALDHLTEALRQRVGQLPLPDDPAAREIAMALLSDPSNAWTLADWAAEVGSSGRTLQRRFREDTGLAFAQWRSLLRMQVAIAALLDGAAVEAAARACGFTSIPAFSRSFRAHTGSHPSEFAAHRRASAPRHDQRAGWPFRSRPAGQALADVTQRTEESALTSPDTITIDRTEASAGSGITRRGFIVGGAATAGLLAACGNEDDGDSAVDGAGTRTVVDALGNEVEIPAEPQRILAADLDVTIALLELGLVPAAAGAVPGVFGEREWHPYHYTLGAGDMTSFLRNEPSLEELASVQPDLVLMASWMEGRFGFAEQYAELAPVVLVDADGGGIVTLRNVADVVGRSGRADEIIGYFESELRRLGEGVSIDTISIAHASTDGQFYVYTSGHRASRLIADSIGAEIVPSPDLTEDTALEGAAYVSEELLGELGGEAVVVLEAGTSLTESPLFATLPAAQAGNVVDGGLDPAFNATVYEGVAGLQPQLVLLTELVSRLAALDPS